MEYDEIATKKRKRPDAEPQPKTNRRKGTQRGFAALCSFAAKIFLEMHDSSRLHRIKMKDFAPFALFRGYSPTRESAPIP